MDGHEPLAVWFERNLVETLELWRAGPEPAPPFPQAPLPSDLQPIVSGRPREWISSRDSNRRIPGTGDAWRRAPRMCRGRVDRAVGHVDRSHLHAVLRERPRLVRTDGRRCPSVSTLGRWRTSVCRFAIRRAAMAIASVTVGSSPSGTFATMTPIANTRAALSGRPMN